MGLRGISFDLMALGFYNIRSVIVPCPSTSDSRYKQNQTCILNLCRAEEITAGVCKSGDLILSNHASYIDIIFLAHKYYVSYLTRLMYADTLHGLRIPHQVLTLDIHRFTYSTFPHDNITGPCCAI